MQLLQRLKLVHSKIMQDSMEESDQPQQLDMDAFHVPLVSSPLLTNQVTATNSPLMTNGLTSQFPYQFAPPYQMAQQVQLHQLMQQDRQLQIFWANQNHEIKNTKDFKNHNLPLARIKKIMKADEDVKMIAAETPVLFSRACEMFILELTYRSWSQAEHSKRRTLQKSDISSAIAKNQLFDFLMDIVPMDDVKDGGAATIPEGEELNEQISCFYDPSKFGPLMVDLRHLPDQNGSHHRLPFGQQHQDCNASAST